MDKFNIKCNFEESLLQQIDWADRIDSRIHLYSVLYEMIRIELLEDLTWELRNEN